MRIWTYDAPSGCYNPPPNVSLLGMDAATSSTYRTR